MIDAGKIDPNSRIYDESGKLDSTDLTTDAEDLIKLEGLSDEAKKSLSDFEEFLGPLKTKYDELQAKLDAGEDLTPEETAWMAKVQELLARIEANMHGCLDADPLDEDTLKALTADIAALKTLSETGPVEAPPSVDPMDGIKAFAQAAYEKRLEDYQKAQAQLDADLKRIEELEKQEASIGLTDDQINELRDLLKETDSLTEEIKADADFFETNPPPKDSDDSSDFNVWLSKQPSFDTLKGTTQALLDRDAVVDKAYNDDPVIGPNAMPTWLLSPGDPSGAARMQKEQAWMDNIKGELQRMYDLMKERPLTDDEKAYMNTLMERAGSIGADLHEAALFSYGESTLDYIDKTIADFNAIRDSVQAAYLVSQRNELIHKYEDLKKQLDDLTKKLTDGTITPDELAQLKDLKAQMSGLLDEVDAINKQLDAFKAENPSWVTDAEAQVDGGDLQVLDTSKARASLTVVDDLLSLADESLELAGYQKTITDFMDRIKAGETLSSDDLAKLQAAIDAYNELSTKMSTELKNILALLESQLPTPGEDGSYTEEQRTQMLDILLKVSQLRGMMAKSSADNSAFLDSVSKTITDCGDLIAGGGTVDTTALGKLSAGINTYLNNKGDRPLDLTEFEDLSKSILEKIGGYDEKIPLMDQIWKVFTDRLDKANAQLDLITKTMQDGQKSLTDVTNKISQLDALLSHTPPYSDDELRTQITALGLDPASINALLNPPHTFVADPATDPKGYLAEAKSVLGAQQDNLKTSNSQQLLLLQQAQNEAASAAQALASFIDAWNKMMESVIQKM